MVVDAVKWGRMYNCCWALLQSV